MRTCVRLSIDVEPSIAGNFVNKFLNPLIHEPVWGSVNGKSEALGFINNVLNEFGLKASFFIETAHVRYFSDRPMRNYVDFLAEHGHDIQLHLHCNWLNFDHERNASWPCISDRCCDLHVERLTQVIREGADRIKTWCGTAPSTFRAGSFATEASVFQALKAAEFKQSSTVCVAVHKPADRSLWLASGAVKIGSVKEYPVTCFQDVGPIGRGCLRPMQITSCSFSEMKYLLSQAHNLGYSDVVILTHPFEFLKRRDTRYTGMKKNKMIQGRFVKLCRYLRDNEDKFEISVFSDVENEEIEVTQNSKQIAGTPMKSIARMLSNGVNDRIMAL